MVICSNSNIVKIYLLEKFSISLFVLNPSAISIEIISIEKFFKKRIKMISKEEMFSKYRALDINSEPLTIKNNKQNARLFDILKHKRLHATSFCNLNDTLESAFTYDIKELSKEDLINFYNTKMDKTKNICSFSIAKNDIYEASDQCEHLMWAHYANAHKGVRIDFKLKNDYEHVQKVNYVYKLTEIKKEDIKKEDTLNEIMTTKLKITML